PLRPGDLHPLPLATSKPLPLATSSSPGDFPRHPGNAPEPPGNAPSLLLASPLLASERFRVVHGPSTSGGGAVCAFGGDTVLRTRCGAPRRASVHESARARRLGGRARAPDDGRVTEADTDAAPLDRAVHRRDPGSA